MGILYISKSKISDNCEEIISIMNQLKINGNVVSNKTIIDGNIENGCIINVVSEPVKEKIHILWKSVQSKLDLTCAHVEIKSHESGCIFDVYKDSICPGKKK